MNVHIVGASGYAAAEAIRLLQRHPHVTLATLESQSAAGEPLGKHFPLLRKLDRRFDGAGSALAACAPGDLVLLAGTHGQARELAPKFLQRGARAIDFSDDFRLASQAGAAVYGFPERYRAAIERADLIANPGCYPTATLLALLPFGALAPAVSAIVVDAKSGITGAGRTPATGSLFAEVDGGIRPYGLGGHRHEPEIAQELDALGIAAPFVFTPHVVPVSRGMLVTAYVTVGGAFAQEDATALFGRTYAGNPFVRILPPGEAPSVAGVRGTNDAELSVQLMRGGIVRVLCAIDNLGKGAAGQAVQNLNLMCGFPEETALDDRAIAS